MTWSGAAALALLPAVMVLLAGCESTQSKSAKLAKQNVGAAASEKGLNVSRQSKDVKVGLTATVTDQNGAAAVVEIRNATKRTLVGVPVLIEARDAKKKPVFKNDTPGLEPSLVSVAALAPGGSILWVNDQLTGEGIKSVTAKAGKDKGNAPKNAARDRRGQAEARARPDQRPGRGGQAHQPLEGPAARHRGVRRRPQGRQGRRRRAQRGRTPAAREVGRLSGLLHRQPERREAHAGRPTHGL